MLNKSRQSKNKDRDSSSHYFSFRVRTSLKDAFNDFCEECGLTMTDAIYILIRKTIRAGDLPFKVEPVDTGKLLGFDEREGKTEQVTVRINRELLDQFNRVCEEIGVSKSGLVKMYFKRCLKDGQLPFFGK